MAVLAHCIWLAPIACKGSSIGDQGRYIPDEDWLKWGREHPNEYDLFIEKDITLAQEHLARFGYGVRFTGRIDDQTTKAVKQYQRRSGLPSTGDLDPRTRQQILSDHDALRQPLTMGSPRRVVVSGGSLLAVGVWIKRGTNLDRLEWDSAALVQMQCHNYLRDKECVEAENTLLSFYGDFGVPSAIINEATVTSWSNTQVNAEYRTPLGGVTVRYWFDVEKETATKAWIRESSSEYWELQDILDIGRQLTEKRIQAMRRIMLLPPSAFAPLPGTSGAKDGGLR